MKVHLHPVEKRMSETLEDVCMKLPPAGSVTIRELLEHLGEQGLLLACLVLCLPYFIPFSLPGASTISGALIILIAVGIATGTVPWLPNLLLNRTLTTEQLVRMLRWGVGFFRRVEHLLKPRLLWLTRGVFMTALNGAVMIVGGLFLMAPFPPFLPLTNTLPGLGVMSLSAGVLQRDGVFVLVGYAFQIITATYFAILGILFLTAGHAALDWFTTTQPAVAP